MTDLKDQPIAPESFPSNLAGGLRAAQYETPEARGVEPDCACETEASPPPEWVYVVGHLEIEFISQARRDSIQQSMAPASVLDLHALLDHLDQNPWEADALVWCVGIEGSLIYALRPSGSFSADTYQKLRSALRAQIEGNAERVAVAGWAGGHGVDIVSHGHLLELRPDPRGIFAWNTDTLIEAVAGKPTTKKDKESEAHRRAVAGVHNFLERVYFEFRNLGQTPHDRALNYAATNAFQAFHVFDETAKTGMALGSVAAEPSPVSRPGSNMWDVKLTFFDPKHRMEVARKVYRITIDVTDVIPVTIGPVRSWSIY